jgi:hypothetical protein
VRLTALILLGFLAAPLEKCLPPSPPCPSPTPCPTPTPGPTPTPTPQPTPTPTPEPAHGCKFPQGVPEGDFTYLGVREPTLGRTVNDAVSAATGCPVGATCELPGIGPNQLFEVVTQRLRDMGLCAGRHDETNPGGSDEIAVAESCLGPWQGYHIYAYTGYAKWSPASYTGDCTIKPVHCGEVPPPPSTCPSYLERFTISMHPKGEYTESYGRLDATPKGDIAYCKSLTPPRNMCPVPDWCLEAVVGTPQWSVLPGERVVICPPEGCTGGAKLTNPYLRDIQGWGSIKICASVYSYSCTVCKVNENANNGEDAEAECAPEVTQ